MSNDDLQLDLTNYKDTTGSYVQTGTYPVVIEDAELGESSNKKTPQLTVWLRVVGGVYDGSTLVENIYLTEGSKFRMVGFLKALNIATPKAKLNLKLRQFIGRRVLVAVSDDEYNGKTRTRVDEFQRFITEEGTGSSAAADLDEFAGTDEAAVELPAEAEAEAAPVAEAAPAPVAKEAAPVAAPAAAVAAPVAAAEDDEGIELEDLELN